MGNSLIEQLGAALPGTVSVKAIQSNLTGGQRSAFDGAESTGRRPSYFDLIITDHSGPLAGSFDGFCIDTDLPLNFEGYDYNNDGDTVDTGIENPVLGRVRELDPIDFSATVYSSYDTLPDGLIEKPENIDSINWLINQNLVGTTAPNGEVYTVGDIQQAIWQLADDDPSPAAANVQLDALFNGFSDSRVAGLVAAAQSNGDGFVPSFGQKVAVILVPDGNNVDGVDGTPDGQIIFAAVDVNKIIEPAGLGDKLFFDTDRDGRQDAGEGGVAGVTVTLTGAGADGRLGTADDTNTSILTDADGMYQFTGLTPGEYKVTFSDIPENFEFTARDASDNGTDSDADPETGMTHIVRLASGKFNSAVDAGIVEKLAGLGDKVFLDADRDGIQDAGEAGVAGVTVTLTGTGADGQLGTADDISGTTTTDANGMYQFTDLEKGDYKVTFSDLPDGFEFTTPNVGGAAADGIDSDANPANGMTQFVSLAPGEFNPTLDAGIVEAAKPGIDIEKFVNGIDVTDLNALPTIAAGADVTFTYTVKNTGNIAFSANEVIVTDDFGTAGNSSDDFSPTLDLSSDANGDGILSAGETWTYSSDTFAAENLTTTTAAKDVRFVFSGNSYLDGHDGNVRTFSSGNVSVDVSAFSSDKHGGHFRNSYLGAYGGGLGATNRNESGSGHRVDNGGSLDYVLFEFDQDVTVDKAFLDYVGHDSDLSVWVGDRNGADISQLDANLLNSFTKENDFTNHGYSRWADINDSNLLGDTVIIAGYTGGSNDSFKIRKLDVSVPGETTVGTYQNVATVTAGNVSDSDTSGYTNPVAAEPLQFVYEAEDLHLSGYRTEHVGSAIASGSEVIKLSDHTGKASVEFDGPSGSYDLLIGYYDENDGHASAKVKVGGSQVDHWVFDQHLPSNVASASTFVERRIEDIQIEAGDKLQLLGQRDYNEFARFDYIKVVSSDATLVATQPSFHNV